MQARASGSCLSRSRPGIHPEGESSRLRPASVCSERDQDGPEGEAGPFPSPLSYASSRTLTSWQRPHRAAAGALGRKRTTTSSLSPSGDDGRRSGSFRPRPPAHTSRGMRRASCAQALNRGGPQGAPSRSGSGRSGTTEGAGVAGAEEVVSQEAAELGPHRRVRIRIDEQTKWAPLPPTLPSGRRRGTAKLDGKPSPASLGGPRREGMLCSVLPRGA